MSATVEKRGDTLAFGRPELVIETEYVRTPMQARAYESRPTGVAF
jgi:hypothetical protein